MKKLLLAAVLVSASPPARALYVAEEPYRFSAEAAYSENDAGGVDSTLWTGSASACFPKVAPGREPVAEGIFGQRASFLGGGYGRSSHEGTPDWLLGLEFSGEGNVYTGSLRVAHVSAPVALEFDYVGTLVEDAEIQLLGPIEEIENLGYDGRLVFYLARRSAVSIGYCLQDFDLRGPPIGSDLARDTTALSLRAKHLASVRMKSWLNLEGGVSEITAENVSAGTETENMEYSVAVDYYVDRFLGFGASFASNDGENESSEGITYAFRITYNHGARFGMQVGYEHFEIEDEADGDDFDAFFISVVLRG